MGAVLEPTPEMGEYSVEVRNESFYLRGADYYDAVQKEGVQPRHSLVLYVARLPLAGEDPLPESERQQKQWIVARGLKADDPVVRDAVLALIHDGSVWRERSLEGHHSVTTCGTVEILTEDIPKIRAALDQVEAHVAQRQG